MQPFDYRLTVQNPVAMALQGYQQGQQFQNQRVQAERDTQLYDMQMKQFQMQEQALAQEQARAGAMQGELGGFAERLAANEATVDDVVSISAKYPELSEQIQASWALKDDAQKEATKKEMVRFGSAIKFSPDDVAVRLVDERIAALRENGNPEDLAAAENIKGYLEMGMPEAALASISLYANNVMKPEEWEAFSNIIMPKRPEAAGEIGQILQNWQNGYYDEFYGPEMAREMAERDLEMAQGGLTEYQRAQLGLDREKLDFEIEQAELDAEAGPEINIDDEGQLRREYNTITKEFRDVQSAFGRIQATDAATPAGQLSLVFQYMKMLDPGSTVREGEFANAENARGVPSSVTNTYNSIMKGKRLTDGQISDFKSQAQNLYGQALGSYDSTRETYEGIATEYGFPTDRTVPDLATMRDFKPKTFLERGMSMLPGGTEPIADEDPEIDSLLQKYGAR